MPSRSRAWTSIILCMLVAPQLATALERFRSWFPRFEAGLNYAVDNNCSLEYTAWKNERPLTPEQIGYGAIWFSPSPASPLIDCILAATPERVKANFNSAAVVLGLMPGILAILGPSIQETSTLLTLGDQPLLALILCLGSPLIGLDRQLHIRGAFRSLSSESVNLGLHRTWWLSSIQYVLAMAAVANIATVTWEIALKCSFTWFEGDAWLLGLWAFVGFVVHLLGSLTLSASISLDYNVEKADSSSYVLFFRWIRWRFSFAKRDTPPHVIVQSPTFTYFLLVAFITLLTAVQIIFGTILFSGVLFISVKDSIGVFFRYLASVIVCRILVLMELAITQPLVKMEDAEDVYKALDQSATTTK